VRVEKADFAGFQHFQDEVTKAYRVWLYLRPTVLIADAPLLEKYLAEQKAGDAATAKILARLYLDHDRAADARKVLDRATPLSPRDTALWDLRISAAANFADEEQLHRAMVKEFPEEPK